MAISRRTFLAAASSIASASLSCKGPGILGLGSAGRPTITGGVASGDVTHEAAIVWSACDKPGRMLVEWSTREDLASPQRVVGPDATSRTGFTAKLDLANLPPDTRIHYRVQFEGLDGFELSEPVTGSFATAPAPGARPTRDLVIAFSGDTCGQGWGIDPARGGMPIYKTLLDARPDLFIHSGDNIYADIPIPPELKCDDGSTWKNLTTPAKSKVAQALDDFRGNYAYNLLDPGLRACNAAVPLLAQWDDHEVRNNWVPGQVLDDPKYAEKDVNTLAGRARQAFLEYMPTRPERRDLERIYRAVPCGPMAEVFLLDERSYRGGNSPNKQEAAARATDFLGPGQLAWLKQSLASSRALWKVIASDMPLGLVCRDGSKNFEAWANADPGKPLGRELELANLLQFIKSQRIRNVVFVTADVHYPASVHYHPDRATFKDFDPFWEFVSGPLHAGGFGPNGLDNTFGPKYEFKHPPTKPGLGPGDGFAYFGLLRIAPDGALQVSHVGLDGKPLWQTTLKPV